MKKLSNSLSGALVQNNIISADREKQCQYGLELMMSSVAEILFVILLSAFLGNFVQTLIFFMGFIPLRIYAGGYHADTRLRCFLILLIIYAIFTVLLYLLPLEIYQYIVYGATVFTIIIVSAMAPLVHSRKNMNDKEIKAFRKIALDICFFEAALVILGSMIFKNNIYILSFVFGQISVTVSMVAADMKNKIQKKRRRI
ncbi:MAG: accessory gene regulator B family protein [Clostridia bacterium]|nr:accessory gene regulator B family protein [Clostridia bacterium]